jgi:hypothetical protein
MESSDKCNSQNLTDGVKKLITTPTCTNRGPKDGMIRGSRRRTSLLEIRYYFLIPGSSYSDMESYEVSGKGHLQ